jgi:hypothetical protein
VGTRSGPDLEGFLVIKKRKKKFKLIGMNVFNHLINILTYYDFLKVQLQGYIIY